MTYLLLTPRNECCRCDLAETTPVSRPGWRPRSRGAVEPFSAQPVLRQVGLEGLRYGWLVLRFWTLAKQVMAGRADG